MIPASTGPSRPVRGSVADGRTGTARVEEQHCHGLLLLVVSRATVESSRAGMPAFHQWLSQAKQCRGANLAALSRWMIHESACQASASFRYPLT
jgi:hypothetical protein